jgi:hypothetical protein
MWWWSRALLAAAAAAAAAPLAAAARSPFFEYHAPVPDDAPSAAPLLKATVLPQAFADAYGAKCLDGSPPAFYSLVQDPAKWVLFIEGES